jgi:hypothetical protein
MQSGGARAEVADEPERVDPGAGAIAARELEAGEGRVGGDRADDARGEEREGGRGRAGREEQADEQREQEKVHERVGGRKRPLRQGEGGVGGVRLDQEHPGDDPRGDGDDGCVEERRVRARVAPPAPAGEQHEPGARDRVTGQVEQVGRRREGVAPERLVDLPRDLARHGERRTERDEQPGERAGRAVEKDADQDGDHCREGDGVVDDAAPKPVAEEQEEGDGKHAQGSVRQGGTVGGPRAGHALLIGRRPRPLDGSQPP